MKCKCGKTVEYDSPDNLCRYCWVNWLVKNHYKDGDWLSKRSQREIVTDSLAFCIRAYGFAEEGVLESYNFTFPSKPNPITPSRLREYRKQRNKCIKKIAAMEAKKLGY